MRRIELNDLSSSAQELIQENEPLHEDIGIFENGELVSVIITPEAYQYFLKKVEQDEDELDRKSLEDFDREKELEDSVDIDDLFKD